MKSTIEDIRQKIQDHYYENEEHIRFNIVIRLLEKLGWDIWNPKEVFAEFLVFPDEDKTKASSRVAISAVWFRLLLYAPVDALRSFLFIIFNYRHHSFFTLCRCNREPLG